MLPIIAGAMMGIGQAGAQLQKDWAAQDLEKMREEAQAERQKALIEAQKEMHSAGIKSAEGMQEKGQTFTAGENLRGREHQTALQTGQQTFTAGENAANRTQQSSLQTAQFAHAEKMQETSIEAAAKEHALNRQVTREGQGIQRQQLDILAKGAALDREIKQIQIDNANTLEDLKGQLLETKDPTERAALTDKIHILTGKDKDKFLPVPLKDEMGNVTGYKIFDTVRGQFADSQPQPKNANNPTNRPPLSSFAPKPSGNSARGESAAPTSGFINSGRAEIPGVNTPLPRTTASTGESKVDQIQRALRTPNLSTEQKAALSLQLQEAMREEGSLGR